MHRPNPEKLLKRVQEEERHKLHGKLKIYFGSAPGVGKTYNMLQDAVALREKGLDVVIGIVETHGRKDLDVYTKKLEDIPRQKIDYRGQKLYEFDLDAALKRNPALILIDEMAHTNVQGLRHAKRWQDIKELLDRGIDVCTTLNVQHIESLNDVISQIVHVHIKETVPDSMLEMADTIELVDIPPEELLRRLQEGKVYIPKQAELAIEHFFRKGNLIALRELALRVTAERVNAEVLLYREGQGIHHVWPTKEKLLVCVGYHSESPNVIRGTRRLAKSLDAKWIAVHVETPRLHLTDEHRNSAIQNLRLAEQLGGETRTLTGLDLVNEIISFAREQNVTTIVVGKRIKPRWKQFFVSSLADELVRKSGEIDVYIVTGESHEEMPAKTSVSKKAASWGIYAATIGIMSFVTGINIMLFPYVNESSLIMIYLLGVSIVALLGRRGPATLAVVFGVLAFDFFFIEPFYSFAVNEAHYIFTFFVMFIVGMTISHFAIISQRQAEVARLAEQHTATLHTLSRQLASTRGVNNLLEKAVNYVSEVFDSNVTVLLPENNLLSVRPDDKPLSAKEQGVAQWVFDMGQIAGLGTDTLPFSDAIYIPLLASQGTIGVMRVFPHRPKHFFTPEQMHLLESCANQIGLAIEVDRMQEHARKSEVQTEADRVQNVLLQSVSHDLRTPLVTVMGAASTLMEMGNELDTQTIKKLGTNIYLELEQLSRLLSNLLQMTYLEVEEVKLQKEPHSLSDTVALVIASNKRLKDKNIEVSIPKNLPEIPYDSVLVQEVFTNLLDNAVKFSPPDSKIKVSARRDDDKVIINVDDEGPGIVPDEIIKLFDKFYRGRISTIEKGMGLGLAICRSIIKAHGGEIWAVNRKEGGAEFGFTLPLHPAGF